MTGRILGQLIKTNIYLVIRLIKVLKHSAWKYKLIKVKASVVWKMVAKKYILHFSFHFTWCLVADYLWGLPFIPDNQMTWGVYEIGWPENMLAEVRILTSPKIMALLNHKPTQGGSTHSFSFCNASRKDKIIPGSHITYLLI